LQADKSDAKETKSAFGGALGATGGFGDLGKSTGFGGGGFGSGGFGGGLGSAFGSPFGVPGTGKLSTFATPSSAKPDTEKPAKAFGAPDSDADEESDAEENDEEGESKSDDETKHPAVEEIKKTKITKGRCTEFLLMPKLGFC